MGTKNTPGTLDMAYTVVWHNGWISVVRGVSSLDCGIRT